MNRPSGVEVTHYREVCGAPFRATAVRRPGASFAVALVSVILSPLVVFFEFTALLFAGMVNAEPSNAAVVKVVTVLVVIVIGLVALAIPVIALVMASKARAASRLMPMPRAGLATAAMVIAGIVTAGVVLAQVYMILMIFGNCSLDGC